jgi:hypothetical protein
MSLLAPRTFGGLKNGVSGSVLKSVFKPRSEFDTRAKSLLCSMCGYVPV